MPGVYACVSLFPVEATPGWTNKMVPAVVDERSGREPCKLGRGAIEPYRYSLLGFDGGKFDVFWDACLLVCEPSSH